MFHALPVEDPETRKPPTIKRGRVLYDPARHLEDKGRPLTKLDYQPVMSIHRDTSNFAEENGQSLLQARRLPMYGTHAKYELKISDANASQPMEGIYMCSLERKQDKLFVTASLTLFGQLSPLPSIPQVEFISCEKNNYQKHQKILTLTPYHETCIRCRAIGFPKPLVGIYRNNLEILAGSFLSVSKYINIAEGGVSEATYVLYSHNALKVGKHSCRAVNDRGSTSIHFQVIY